MRRVVLIFVTLILCVAAWDDGDFEVFDVVEEVNQNFYELMGVSQDASSSEIKSAFKKLTLKLHPDKNDAPDADVQFRNLVSVHNILKDPGKREKYNEVLKNGLPNWRSAVYYYRHVRKMGLAEGSLILFIIVTFGQYAVSWAAYAEKRYTAEQILNTRGKKHIKKSGFDTGLSDILDQLPKPSIKDTLPFQIPRMVWWTIMAIPRGISEFKRRKKEQEEEARRQKKREEEEKARAQREAAAAAEAKERGARRRRGFVPPERACLLDAGDEPEGDAPPQRAAPAPPVITGGLWTDDDLAELVRLVKKYPGGSGERWERIAESMCRSVAEVTHMAAKMKENCYKLPGQEPEAPVLEPPKKVKTRKTEESSGGSWSQAQQAALETALAKHPKGGAGDRWQKIAGAVPGKTKEECMQRCKYLSEMVKKQKQKEEEEQNQSQGNGECKNDNEDTS
ncbi:dnaJ homolog subfamily C member 1 [Pectinophora gossypiella]|uniref:dnaJ homolog subfamily C member 1 n=1 Tax=Pectinophora gossypiella TaxID=13191 RepID=UPI00214E17F5|nr:dnaJ homolog subfamily C member 1 [Pectinophora gossypiella]